MNLPSSQAPPSALGRGLDMDAPTVAVGVVVSVVLHTTILGLVVLGTWHTGEKIEERIEPKMLEFEEADLLVLGEEKPAEQLPRISNPAPPEVKEDAVNLARKKEPREPEKEVEEVEPEPEEPKKSDSREKMLEALSQMHDSQRPTNEDLPEGSEQGVVGGQLVRRGQGQPAGHLPVQARGRDLAQLDGPVDDLARADQAAAGARVRLHPAVAARGRRLL